jgi:anaerobic selenocysteine-containing dehydrogenase
MREARSFCRLCGAMCGTTVTIDDEDRIVRVRPDRDNPMSNGYACFKGIHADEMHNGAERLRHTLKRMPDGSFVRIDSETALDEIAAKMQAIIDREGRDAISLYTGAGSYLTSTVYMMLPMFREALGTRSYFTTATIDQSAKFVVVERLGAWAAGKHALVDSDVILLIGTNPLVAHATAGCLVTDPVKTLRQARARGLKMIVIDPRRTESAVHADLFLQPYPGEDPTVVSGLLRLILAEGWADDAFMARHVKPGGVERLRASVEPFTPDYVAARAGISATDLRRAAEMFTQNKRGSAFSGTGPSMAPRANLSEHLIELLNVVCGRYRQAGERIHDINVFAPPRDVHAEVFPPARGFEKVPPSRIRGAGSLWGEMMTSTLPDEILTPGEGQIRCLINGGGNPASSFPDQRKTVQALKALELFVSISPHMTNSARLSHYVFAPKLQYERADLPMMLYDMSFYPVAWGQYTPELVRPPEGSDLVDDWYVLWGLAKRLGLQMHFRGEALDMNQRPTTDDIIELRVKGSLIPLDEIKRHPSGKIFDLEQYVQPARAEATGQFDVMPDDVAATLAEVAAEAVPSRSASLRGFTHLLQVRRIRETNNSSEIMLDATRRRMPYNWAAMNPFDLQALQLQDGAKVTITSDNASIPAVVKADEAVREGVLVMTHGWGGLPDDEQPYEAVGSNVNLLISTERHVEPINAMVRMSAIPVSVTARE